MSQKIYIDEILEPIVKSVFQKRKELVLEKDGDSDHESQSVNSKTAKWKWEHNIKSYFNCARSLDLAIIENCWQPVKSWIDKSDHWDDNTLKAQIIEGWEKHVPQGWINYLVHTMSDCLHDVEDLEGQMTAW